MRDWYKYETGNEQRKDALLRHLRRLKVNHEVEDRSAKERCNWWRIKVLITNPEQISKVNAWLNAN